MTKKNLLNPGEIPLMDGMSLKKVREEVLKKNTLNRTKHLLALDKPVLEEGLTLLNNSTLFNIMKNFLLNSWPRQENCCIPQWYLQLLLSD
jgi:hypothetical protein